MTIQVTIQEASNLPELLSRDIGEKIIRNELKPGERILENKIAESMGVSRSPLREALRILEKNGLVELIPRKGARVTEITADHIEWFYDIFEALYGLVARTAAVKATEEDRQNLLEALKKIERHAENGDVDLYFEGIFEFAAVGMKTARNPLLENLVLDLWPSNRRLQFASLSFRADELKNNVTYFQKIYAYLKEGKIDKIETVVRAYARNEKAFAMKFAVLQEETQEALSA